MTDFIAALPMYDWPEYRANTDAEWTRFRDMFRRAGIEAPESIVRRNADMPPVPGGILGDEGSVVAPDPATLPPDELDMHALWRHPKLLLGQTCWGPMDTGLAAHVIVVGQPSYNGIEGGSGTDYSSAIVMRGDPADGAQSPDGAASIPLDLIRGKRFAYNNPDSMSGLIGITRDLAAMGEDLSVFSERIETGGHRNSIIAIAEGRADVAAIDCRSWKMAQRHEPAAQAVRVVGWTARRPGLPMITSRHTPPEIVAALKEALNPK